MNSKNSHLEGSIPQQDQSERQALEQMEAMLHQHSVNTKILLKQINTSADKCDMGLVHDFLKDVLEPSFNPHKNYSKQFWEIYMQNETNFSRAADLSLYVKQLAKITQQEMAVVYQERTKKNSNKRNRRIATDINRDFKCPYERCYRVYGSDVSLNLHIKIKHNGGNKSDRQKLAKQICLAEINHQEAPECEIEFPPGYLEEMRKKILTEIASSNQNQSKSLVKIESQQQIKLEQQ